MKTSGLLMGVHDMNDSAISELFANFWKMGNAYGRRIGSATRETVEDAVSTVFADIIAQIKKGKRFDNLEPHLCSYFFTAIRFELYNAHRKNKAYKQRQKLFEGGGVSTPASIFEAKQSAERLRVAIDKLPKNCRQVVNHVYIKEQPAITLARERGVSKQCIFNLNRTALTILKKVYG